MSNNIKRYEVIDEFTYLDKVSRNETFTGFVKYPNNIFSFVLSEVTVHQTNASDDLGRKHTWLDSIIRTQFIEFKPLRNFIFSNNDRISLRSSEQNRINPQNQDNRNPAHTIKNIYAVSEFYTNFEENFLKFNKGYYDADAKVKGLSKKDGYVSDSETPYKANKTNQWVNESGIFYADNYTDINTAEFANFILGCLIYGVGPENISFPTNGTVSSSLKESGIVKDALSKFYALNKGKTGNLSSMSSEINGTTPSNNLRSIFQNGFFHPETLIGSANVRVEQYDSTHLLVTIFNITSLTSGDFGKHLPGNEYPQSLIREKIETQIRKVEYGNTSQTYSFTIPINFSRLK